MICKNCSFSTEPTRTCWGWPGGLHISWTARNRELKTARHGVSRAKRNLFPLTRNRHSGLEAFACGSCEASQTEVVLHTADDVLIFLQATAP